MENAKIREKVVLHSGKISRIVRRGMIHPLKTNSFRIFDYDGQFLEIEQCVHRYNRACLNLWVNILYLWHEAFAYQSLWNKYNIIINKSWLSLYCRDSIKFHWSIWYLLKLTNWSYDAHWTHILKAPLIYKYSMVMSLLIFKKADD